MTTSRRTLLKHLGAGGALSLAGCLGDQQAELPGTLSKEWVSETSTEYDGNHHAIATATTDGSPIIGIPRNGVDGSEECGVIAIDRTGDVLWQNALPPEHCGAHAIGDIGVGDLSDNDRPEFLAATETHDVFAYDAASGEESFRQELLDSIGYSAPVVADLTGDGSHELIVVDFEGNLTVVRADGSIVWTHELDQPVYVTPIVADLTGDGTPNLAVNHGRNPGEVVCFDGDGEIVWQTEQELASVTWSLVEQNGETGLATTTRDDIALLEGTTGELQWTKTVGNRPAVGQTDGDTVYATARDGAVRALALDDGAVRWTEQVIDEDVRMPAPAIGSITGNETSNIAVTGYDGTVAVLDAETGDLLARHRIESDLYTAPVVTDVSGDGRDDVLVLYGDARVAAFSYEE